MCVDVQNNIHVHVVEKNYEHDSDLGIGFLFQFVMSNYQS